MKGYTILGLVRLGRDELLPTRFKGYPLLSLLPNWTWERWLLVGVVLIAAAVLEGAYQHHKANQKAEAEAHPVHTASGEPWQGVIKRSAWTSAALPLLLVALIGAFWTYGRIWHVTEGQKYRSIYLSKQEAQLLTLLHDNAVLNYEAYLTQIVPIYRSSNKLLTDICKKFRISDARLSSDCRIYLDRKVTYLVTAPAESKNGCFEYDPARLYVTNKINTLFNLYQGYTILGDRNWPVAFDSEKAANSFLELARAHKNACFVGGIHKPSLSDVVFEWPTAKRESAVGLCQYIDPNHITVLESTEAAFVIEQEKKLLRFSDVSEANAAAEMARGHSSICVVGGLPGINAPNLRISPFPLLTGDRVLYLN